MAHSNLALLQGFSWETTALGPLERWPDEVRGIVSAALNSAFPICTAWGDDHLQIYNDAYNAIFGAKHPASFGAPARESWPEIWEFLAPALAQVRDSREPLWFEGTLLPLARAGVPEECYFDFSYSPVLSRAGEVLGVMSAAVDRTQEMVLRRRKPAESWSFPSAVNADLLGVVGAALQERLGDNAMDAWHAALHPADAGGALSGTPAWQLRARPELRGRLHQPPHLPRLVQRLTVEGDGEHASYAHLLPLSDARGHPVGAITLVPSVLVPEHSHREFCTLMFERLHAALREAEARRAELLLLKKDFREREQLYAFLFENMEDAAFYTATGPGTGDEGVLLAANGRTAELTGYSIGELVGMRREALFFPHDAQLRDAVAARSRSRAFLGELQLRRKDGSALPVELSARLVEIGGGNYRSVCIVRDVSWRRAREKALAERARFDAMVELTGGIAHDFNNFLTVILGNLDVLKDGLAADSAEHVLVSNAMLGAERAAALTDQLLSYAKRRTLRTGTIRWQPFLGEIAGLLASTLGETRALKLELAQDLPPCELDAAQLTSTLLNLAANARDAMPTGGTLTIRARHLRLDSPGTGEDGYELPVGDYVELCISDTGTGIPAESLRRIFEPFYSTKDADAGSGLGLAMVQGFVRQSGGDVRVASREGAGAQFQLLFPTGTPADGAVAPSGFTAGDEVVLLVEDNDAVRRQTLAMLRSCGLRTLEARDADSALQQLQSQPQVDVLVANVTLPGLLSGVDLAQAAREQWPHLAVLLTTGGARGALAERVEAAGLPVLRKPFTARDLTQALLFEVRGRTPPRDPPAD
jgi:PAS domain S-box-containing protein